MNTPRAILSGLIVLIVLAALGFTGGYMLYQRGHKHYVPQDDSVPGTQASALPQKIYNDTRYQISPPSRGAAYFYVPVSLGHKAGALALTMVPAATQTEKIAQGQKVLLYDASGYVLDIIGQVEAVEPAPDQRIAVRILIQEYPPEWPASNAAWGEIVLERVNLADRLPLSALRPPAEKGGASYIWESVRDAQGGSAPVAIKRYPYGVRVIDEDFFIYENVPHISGVFILNPGDGLREGQILTAAEEVLYSPGKLPDVVRIGAIRHDLRRREKEILEQGLGDAPAASGTACGNQTACGNGVLARDFVSKIKAMAAEQAARQKND